MVNELSSSNSYSNIEVEDLEINPNKIDELFLSNETRQKVQSQPLHIKTANSFPELNRINSLNLEFSSQSTNHKKIKVRTLRPKL